MQKNNDIPIGARLSNLDKIFKESVRSYCNKQGLNFTYSKIIMMLHRHPEGVIQNDIVDNTYLKKSTISLTLKSMEQEGYITRVTCADDNRKIIVKITEEGKKFDNKIRKCFGVIENYMIEDLTEEEIENFVNLIEKMKNSLERQKGDK